MCPGACHALGKYRGVLVVKIMYVRAIALTYRAIARTYRAMARTYREICADYCADCSAALSSSMMRRAAGESGMLWTGPYLAALAAWMSRSRRSLALSLRMSAPPKKFCSVDLT